MECEFSMIDKSQMISVINQTLCYMDERLVKHGERVAYIICELLSHADEDLKLDRGTALVLGLLHDIGAYKTEEIDEMFSFHSEEVWSHSIYGYLFLKNLSPLGESGEAILYHHLDYQDYRYANSPYLDYAALIYLADRLDILVATNGSDCNFDVIVQESGTRFHPKFVELLFQTDLARIVRTIKDGSYHQEVERLLQALPLTHGDALEYLKMMALSIDFRSEYTVTHTIHTAAISVELAKRLGMSAREQSELYVGALLHDIGKVAISPDILEFQGRLTPEQMEVMKTHVVYTRRIIEGLVDPVICRIASRHHEKLDGSGYPDGLAEADLSQSEQIMAVADIVSALTGKRSYKAAFPKQRTLDIVREMKEKGQLCRPACEMILSQFDDMMERTDDSLSPIIELYGRMQQEYFALNEKIQTLLQNSKTKAE